MNSLVLGLQNEITRSGCDVVNVLRKAHLYPLNLIWLNSINELNMN